MKKRKAKKSKATRQLMQKPDTWGNMTVIGHRYQPHPDPGKPYCADCGWPAGNHQ